MFSSIKLCWSSWRFCPQSFAQVDFHQSYILHLDEDSCINLRNVGKFFNVFKCLTTRRTWLNFCLSKSWRLRSKGISLILVISTAFFRHMLIVLLGTQICGVSCRNIPLLSICANLAMTQSLHKIKTIAFNTQSLCGILCHHSLGGILRHLPDSSPWRKTSR